MAGPEARRFVEQPAQTLDEASDPGGPRWVRRGRVGREPWLEPARPQIVQSEHRLEHDHKTVPDGEAEPCEPEARS